LESTEKSKTSSLSPFFLQIHWIKRLDKLGKERLIEALKELGFSKRDTLVYIFLAKNGPCTFKKIAKYLKIEKGILDRSLKDLSNLGIIDFSIKDSSKFHAISFEELIDLFIEVKKEQAKTMKENKDKLLLNWRTILKKNSVK
jgi:sugar-specific transcriptional regulator TrmB